MIRVVGMTGAALVLLLADAAPARAQLIGTTVTGEFRVNGVGPNLFAPPDVVISAAAPEFDFDDGANHIVADFDANTLTLTDASRTGSLPQFFVFTNSAFAGLSLSKTSDNYPNGGLDVTFLNDQLFINTANFLALGGNYSATFVFSSASVPEPSALLLGAVASLPLIALAARRRRRV
ncbi:MAG: hypothetical protein U0835_19995 [Isosphaeraceae bacterium]